MKKENTVFYILRLTVTLLLICAAVAAVLAGVNAITKDKIADIQAQKTQDAIAVVLPGASGVEQLALAMSLCSDAVRDENGQAQGEPTECALVNDAEAVGVSGREAGYERIGEAPFDSSRKMMSVVCRDPEGEACLHRLLQVGDLRLPFVVTVDEKGRGVYASANYNIGMAQTLLRIQALMKQ
jgi:magnesium-transporting ATPase (P-type)